MAYTPAQFNIQSTLSGNFKEVYASKIIQSVPEWAVLQKRIEFLEAKKIGDQYEQPVALSQEAGVSYLGETDAVVTLEDAVAAHMKPAQVKGSAMLLRSQMSYQAAQRAAEAGQAAFKRSTAWLVESMNLAIRRRIEVSMLYGQSGIGTVDVVTDLGSNQATISITAATWAGGIWAGAEGIKLDAYTSSTKNNSTAALQILAVDADTRTLTVSYGGSVASEVASGDVLYFTGSFSNDMAGLKKIITNTGSLFGISAADYSMWKGTSYSAGSAALTHSKLQEALSKAANKGLMEEVCVLVSPKTWASLCADQAALRMFDSSYSASKGENGFESLKFHSNNGPCEVVSHPMVKDGDGFILPLDSAVRIGSVDLTFALGGRGDEFFQYVANKNAFELQCMSDQAVFLERPAHAVYVSGIV